jgi:hypothetical protein
MLGRRNPLWRGANHPVADQIEGGYRAQANGHHHPAALSDGLPQRFLFFMRRSGGCGLGQGWGHQHEQGKHCECCD